MKHLKLWKGRSTFRRVCLATSLYLLNSSYSSVALAGSGAAVSVTKPEMISSASIGSETATSADIRCILSDVDGTLTYGKLHDCKVSDETIESIKDAISKGFLFFPATGRTRSSMNMVTKGAISSIFDGLEKTPGVYQQGLMVYGADGALVWERLLPLEVGSVVATRICTHVSRNNNPEL